MEKITQKRYADLEIDGTEKDIVQIWMNEKTDPQVVQVERCNLQVLIDVLKREVEEKTKSNLSNTTFSFQDMASFFKWCFIMQLGKYDLIYLTDQDLWLNTKNNSTLSWLEIYRIYEKEN